MYNDSSMWVFSKRHLKPAIFIACFLLVAIVAGFVVHLKTQPPIALPASTRKMITYPVLLPQKDAAINTSSYKFDPSQKVLSFTARLHDGQVVTFTEQATPEPFSDIPNFYTRLLDTLNEYQSFDGLHGTVYLTHPKGAGQAAVINTKGTLIFARVIKDEPQSVWQPLFNDLKITVVN